MTVHGRIECRISPGSNATCDFFITFYNFLMSLSSIGVTRIACNFGSGGTGFDYRDAPTTIGTNAFAVFRFGNAQIPFNVLIQCINPTQGAVAGTAPFAFSQFGTTTTTYFGTCITVAQRLDGTNAWAGTTVNTGTDTKGTPVWTPGGSSLAAFPRINSTGGTYATNREAMMFLNCVTVNSSEYYLDLVVYGVRAQFLADEDNLLIIQDRSADGTSCPWYFGRYSPRPGLSIQSPYICLHHVNPTFDPMIPQMLWGATTQNTSQTFVSSGDGGVIHPTFSNGIKIAYTDISTYFNSTFFTPNKASGSPGRIDLMPIYVTMNEVGNYGLLGTIAFFRSCYNVPPMYMSPDRRLVAFGNGVVASSKIMIPWDGQTAPGSGITRQGISF